MGGERPGASKGERAASAGPGPSARGRRLLLAVGAALLLLTAAWLLRRHHQALEQAAAAQRRAVTTAVALETATARQGDLGVYLDALGTVTPVHTASITSQVNGLVVAVHYQEGQLVRTGDPLVDIDDRLYRATLMQAEGALERDQNLLAQAKMDLTRYRAALSRNATAEQVVADQEKLVAQDEGTVQYDRGVVQYDRLQVDYCHLTSPFAGRVGLRLLDPGNVVQSSGGAALVVVTELQPITVVFTIPEDELPPVEARLRDKATLTVEALDRSGQTRIARGTLLALDNQIDTTTGTVKGRALFDNADLALFPNQFVNTRLLVNTLRGVTLIPDAAVQRNGTAAFVYVIEDNTAHVRDVKLGVTDAGMAEVEGLKPGEQVAITSFEKLQDRAKVVVTRTPPPAEKSASRTP